MQSRVAAIILAAGRSTRMGAGNKLLADLGDKPLVRHAAEAALASTARPVIVVTGNRGADVAKALDGLDVQAIDNPDFAQGLSSSLKCGIRAVPAACEGALVMLGDMPAVTAPHLERMIAAFRDGGGGPIVVPMHMGRRGNPVLWPARYFTEMLQLEGDVGARQVLAAHAGDVCEIDLGTDAIFADVDTPDELERIRRRSGD
jgi:molybdenum cofactor cytidylyltransferase